MNALASTLAAASLGCALLFAPLAHAASDDVPLADARLAAPAMWRVADEDTTIYLFGTVHALPENVEWYRGPMRYAFEASQTLVTEIPMQPEDEAAMQQFALTAGRLPEGTTLRSLLDEEQVAIYDNAMTRVGMPVGAFDEFEPWLAGLTLTLLPLMQQGYSPDAGVDKQLIAKAGPEMEFAALETVEFQIGIFDSMPQEDQIAFLLSSAGQIDDVKGQLDAMVDDWIAGDTVGLAAVMNEGLESDPELAEALLYARNANWAAWIDERLDTPGTVFVAVGAGHLAGEKSVQDLLDQRGIASVRVQ